MFAGEGDGYALSRVSPRGQDEPTPPLNCSAAYDGHNPPKTARAGNVSGPLDTDALDIPRSAWVPRRQPRARTARLTDNDGDDVSVSTPGPDHKTEDSISGPPAPTGNQSRKFAS
ncbi:hypothetical protein Ct61P_00418 [Colletotrichum tofieldiae]|nr:hypothetical protein Ct61P_00418 [Colletotrichum tofieldiae]